jgi:hypothetical protein
VGLPWKVRCIVRGWVVIHHLLLWRYTVLNTRVAIT